MLISGWYLLYPNNPDGSSYSTNYFEYGVHSQPDMEQLVYPDRVKRYDKFFTVPLANNIARNIVDVDDFDSIPKISLFHVLVKQFNSTQTFD